VYGIGPFARQFLIREAFASDMLHRQNKTRTIVRQLAKVVAKHLLVQIPEQMEWLNGNISAFQAALEKTPEILQPVCVDLPINVLFGMVYNIVLIAVVFESVVGREVIGIDRATCFDVGANVGFEQVPLAITNCRRANLSAALQDAHNSGFVLHATLRDLLAPLVSVHEASRTTDESLIYFNFLPFAAKWNRVLFVQSPPNAMHHVPSRLLCDSQSAANFIGTDSVLGIDDQPNADHPLIHAQRGVLKDRPYLDGELLFAVFAEPDAARRDEGMLSAIAARTRNIAIRPAQLHRVVERLLRIREVRNCFLQSLGKLECCAHG
jgi:hypothetical protein